MAKAVARQQVTIRTLVAMAGPGLSLAAGDTYEVDEEVATARIAAGLAEAVEPPADVPPAVAIPAAQRRSVTRGKQTDETTALAADEERKPAPEAKRG